MARKTQKSQVKIILRAMKLASIARHMRWQRYSALRHEVENVAIDTESKKVWELKGWPKGTHHKSMQGR